jgi:tyrosyl-tRNA synthetase
MPEYRPVAEALTLAQLLQESGLAKSISEARNKVREGAVRIDGEKISMYHAIAHIFLKRTPNQFIPPKTDQEQYVFEKPFVLQLGRHFRRIMV